MVDVPRKKSPRAPSLPLDDALVRIMKVYERERLHAAPTEIVAQHLGYKSANNGSALSTLASLRYFGLLDRPKEGLLAVAKEVESYQFAPDEKLKRSFLLSFLKRPSLYNELLEKYESGLPSDANLKFELIQRGFAPQAADTAVGVFKRSVEFTNYFGENIEAEDIVYADVSGGSQEESKVGDDLQPPVVNLTPSSIAGAAIRISDPEEGSLDRIPVRLPGGRRAWLLIPTPFYNADKERIKAQIDLLLTKEDEDSSASSSNI